MALFRFSDPMAEAPALASGDLRLRAPRLSDHAEWAELREKSRNFLAAWEPIWPADELSRESFRRRIKRYAEEMRRDEAYPFFLIRESDQRLIGGLTLGFLRRGVAQAATLGYWIGAPYAQQGPYGRRRPAWRSPSPSGISGCSGWKPPACPITKPRSVFSSGSAFARKGWRGVIFASTGAGRIMCFMPSCRPIPSLPRCHDRATETSTSVRHREASCGADPPDGAEPYERLDRVDGFVRPQRDHPPPLLSRSRARSGDSPAFGRAPAGAVDAIRVNPDTAAIDMTKVVQYFHSPGGDTIQISTAPGADGIVRRIAVKARTAGLAARLDRLRAQQRFRPADRPLARGAAFATHGLASRLARSRLDPHHRRHGERRLLARAPTGVGCRHLPDHARSGRHRHLCGRARDAGSAAALSVGFGRLQGEGERADPLSRHRHRHRRPSGAVSRRSSSWSRAP